MGGETAYRQIWYLVSGYIYLKI